MPFDAGLVGDYLAARSAGHPDDSHAVTYENGWYWITSDTVRLRRRAIHLRHMTERLREEVIRRG